MNLTEISDHSVSPYEEEGVGGQMVEKKKLELREGDFSTHLC